MDFDAFTVVLLIRVEDGPTFDRTEGDAVQDAHLAFLADLRETGALIAAGPVRDPESEIRGVSLLTVPVDEALRICADDPAVRAGLYTLRALPWATPVNVLRAGPGRLPRSIAEVLG